MTAQDMYDAAVETGRAAAAEAYAGQPVLGPAAPSEADCRRATSITEAAMADPDAGFGEREREASEEAAVYSAAYHLGLDESEPEVPPELELEAG